jgi:hypothetical protein
MSTTNAAVSHAVPVLTTRHAVWIDALVGLLCVLPLLLTAHLPLEDLPDHLAVQYVIKDWAASPYLQQFYAIHWALVPNLALEFFVLAARHVISIDLAVRLFCIVTLLTLFLGTRMINLTLSAGRGRIYRVVPLLCYGGPFQFGFLSYCLGIGLALMLFGLYLRLRPLSAARVALFMPLSFVLLLCHLAAFGLFAMAVGACELTGSFQAAKGDLRRLPAEVIKGQIAPLCCLVPVFVLFLGLSPTADPGIVTSNAVTFSTLWDKARSVAAITLFGLPRLELPLLALAMAGLAYALLRQVVRIHVIGPAVVGIMLLIWVPMPLTGFHTSFIDYRLPWAIAFFLLGCLVPGPHYATASRSVGMYFGALVVARIAIIAAAWMVWEPTIATIDRTLASLPLGTRMMVVEGRTGPHKVRHNPDLLHVASYLVARRQGFEPGIFASIPGSVLVFQPHYLALWKSEGAGSDTPSVLDHIDPDYDYVLVVWPALAHIASRLPMVCQAHGTDFELYRVVRSANPADQAGCAS